MSPRDYKIPEDKEDKAKRESKEYCPGCESDLYSSYANGTWLEGYCQDCGLETKVESKEIKNLRKINVSKPKAKPVVKKERW